MRKKNFLLKVHKIWQGYAVHGRKQEVAEADLDETDRKHGGIDR